MADEPDTQLAAAVNRMARDILDHAEEINELFERTDVDAMGIEDLRNLVGELTGIVRLFRVELQNVAAVALEVSREVGVWPEEADALAEYFEHLVWLSDD